MRRSTAVLSVVIAVLAVALADSIAWQAHATGGAAPKPTPAASEWAEQTVAASGFTPATFPVPRGAHSVTIRVACTDGGRPGSGNASDAAGGGIGIDILGQHGRFAGCDDGEHVYTLPVKYSPAGITVQISADESAHFTLSAIYSTTTAGPDRGTTIQCAGVSKTLSAVYRAELDYANHKITRDQWAARIDDASMQALGILPQRSMLDHEVVAMQDVLADPGVRPGQLYEGLAGALHPSQPEWEAAVNLTEQVCDYNGTGVQIA